MSIDSTKTHHIGTAIDNNTTTIQDMLLDMSKKIYNRDSMDGANNCHGVVYRVENDPSKYNYSEVGDNNNNLGVRTMQFQVLLQGKMGALFPTPNTFGTTAEDRILINNLPTLSLAHQDVKDPDVGDNVLCNFYNTRALNNGVIQHKYVNKNEGNSSGGVSQVLRPSSASKGDKSPAENS
jgi:hypothetical protein